MEKACRDIDWIFDSCYIFPNETVVMEGIRLLMLSDTGNNPIPFCRVVLNCSERIFIFNQRELMGWRRDVCH